MASSTEPLPSLIVITDWTIGSGRLLNILGRVLAVSPRIALQHRHPGAETFEREAETLANLCARFGNPFIVNGRADVAHRLGAHLHLANPNGANALPDRWLSCSVHSEGEIERTKGATFALVSPVFRPRSKPDDTRAPLGLERFGELAQILPCPAYALGGMTPKNTPAGFAAAVIGSILFAADPASQAEAFLSRSPR